MEHGGAQAGQFQHLVAAHRLHQLRVGHLAGIGGEHSGHIGVDLAGVGAEGRCQGHRRGVGAAPAEGGDLRGTRGAAAGALEPRHHHHLALLQEAQQPIGSHLQDAGAAMGRFRHDSHLGSGHRHRRDPLGMEGHRQQRDRHLLPGGQQHVHLPPGRIGADRPGQPREFIGGVAHRRHHNHQVMAVFPAGGDPPGHRLDAFHIGHGGPSEFLYEQGHRRWIAIER